MRKVRSGCSSESSPTESFGCSGSETAHVAERNDADRPLVAARHRRPTHPLPARAAHRRVEVLLLAAAPARPPDSGGKPVIPYARHRRIA